MFCPVFVVSCYLLLPSFAVSFFRCFLSVLAHLFAVHFLVGIPLSVINELKIIRHFNNLFLDYLKGIVSRDGLSTETIGV
jgi:hypothetical protein